MDLGALPANDPSLSLQAPPEASSGASVSPPPSPLPPLVPPPAGRITPEPQVVSTGPAGGGPSSKKAMLLGVLAAVLLAVAAGVGVVFWLKGQTAPSAPSETSAPASQQGTHKECQGGACTVVPGAGQDTCQSSADCPAATYTFRTCEGSACVVKDCEPRTTPCAKDTDCKSGSDCKTTYKHKVCLGVSCSVVDCSPPTVACGDLCSSDASCQSASPSGTTSPTTHRECRNSACVVVSGAGRDTCTSDVSCMSKAELPPIPASGNTMLTVGGLLLGVGVIVVGLLLIL